MGEWKTKEPMGAEHLNSLRLDFPKDRPLEEHKVWVVQAVVLNQGTILLSQGQVWRRFWLS